MIHHRGVLSKRWGATAPRADSEMDVRRQHKGPGFARMIAIAALVDGGHVIGIKQVIHIELQIEVAVDPIAQFGVGNPVALGVIRGTAKEYPGGH